MGSLNKSLESFPPRAAGSAAPAALSRAPEYPHWVHSLCRSRGRVQLRESENVMVPEGLMLPSRVFHRAGVIPRPGPTSSDQGSTIPPCVGFEWWPTTVNFTTHSGKHSSN